MGKSSDFQFWEENLPLHPQGCSEVEHGTHEDRPGACSPPLWRQALVNFKKETSPLGSSCSYSCPSPTSRLQAIANGRKELMEMIKNMPESLYELSPKSSQICRTESMESEVFLLKTFLPRSLSFNKKSKTRKQSTITPGLSERPEAKKWWKFVYLAVKCNQSKEHINRSTSDISSHRTSLDENTLMPCRDSFNKKPKPRRQRGCLF